MKCLFHCSNDIVTHSFPLCKSHLNDFGLQLSLLHNEALEDAPTGIGPFLIAAKDYSVPTLAFKMSGVNPVGQARSIRLPTFRENDVIFSALAFKNLAGNNEKCGEISAITLSELEKLRRVPEKKDSKFNDYLKSQAAAEAFLKVPKAAAPQASRPLLKLFQSHPDILTTNVFRTSDTTGDAVHEDTHVPFTVKWPTEMTKMMALYPKFDNKNSLWYSIVYHLHAEKVKMGATAAETLSLEPNVQLEDKVGLVAMGDIFPGSILVLKGKEIDFAALLCYLVAPTTETITLRD